MAENAVVQITYNAGVEPPVTITPSSAQISGPGCATWNINAPGYQVTITFDNGECPFPPVGNAPEGVYICSGASITTEPASSDTNGEWGYVVTMSSTDRGAPTPPASSGMIVVGGNP